MVANVVGRPGVMACGGEKPMPAYGSATPFVLVFGGCISSIVFMEYLLKQDSNAGNMINASEFVFVLLQSIPSRIDTKRWALRPLHASPTSHIQHAMLWVAMSTLANYVFAYNIAVPIHTLFRSCNIIASVVLGYLLFAQRYTLWQVGCILVITVGILFASVGDAKAFITGITCSDCMPGSIDYDAEMNKWSLGVAMLLCVQLLQATLGHTQAVFYRRFADKAPRNELADEYLFTSHVVSLVMILVLWKDISTSWALAAASPPLCSLLPIPSSFVFMVLNNLTQLCCIKGVFRLSANFSPLTVNVTLSVRKFFSVVLSAVWFGNPWTHLHSIATVLIFGGVFAYSNSTRQAATPAKKAE